MRTGLYPGTFDPITKGHEDIIRRSMKLFDELVIAVAINRFKGPLFSLEERVDFIETTIDEMDNPTNCRLRVVPFESLLVNFAHEQKANVLIRGLRAVSDFEYEFQMVGMNRALDPELETVFLMADAHHQAIASRLVKEVGRLGGDVSPFVSSYVQKALKDKYKQINENKE